MRCTEAIIDARMWTRVLLAGATLALSTSAQGQAPAPVGAAPPAPPPPPAQARPAPDDDAPATAATNADQYPSHELSSRVMAGVQHRRRSPAGAQGNEDTRDTELFLQQARIKAVARFHEDLRANLSLELSDGLRPGRTNQIAYLRNAYLQLRALDELQLRAGHFKRPYSRFELTSVRKLPFRGRGLFNGTVIEDAQWGDRSVGAMLWGRRRAERLKWYVGVSQPSWAARGSEQAAGYTLQARVTYDPLKWLSLGLGGGHKYLNYDDLDDGAGAPDDVRMAAFGADAAIRTKRLRIALEVLAAQRRVCGANVTLLACKFDQDLFDPSGGRIIETRTPWASTVTAYAAYRISLGGPWAIEPTLFAEYADADREFTRTEAIRASGGANLLWGKHLRVMAHLDVVEPLGDVRTDVDRPLSRPVNPWVKERTAYVLVSAQM